MTAALPSAAAFGCTWIFRGDAGLSGAQAPRPWPRSRQAAAGCGGGGPGGPWEAPGAAREALAVSTGSAESREMVAA